MATIDFLGGAGTVTGSKFLLETNSRRLLVDCGLYQGEKALRLRNWVPLPVDPRSIDAVVLTHGHIDHTGYLPRLIRDGFAGPVYASRATADLLRILLPDSGHLQEEEAAYHNRHGTSKHAPALPLYTAEDGVKAAERVTGVGYGEPVELAPDLHAWFRRAGHILGSAIVMVEAGGDAARRRVVFSGDLGRYGAPILPDPAPLDEVDAVVVEATYGDRRHDPEPIAAQLERVIMKAVDRGGAIVVPAFAIGRTQELMFHLAGLEKAGRIPTPPATWTVPWPSRRRRSTARIPKILRGTCEPRSWTGTARSTAATSASRGPPRSQRPSTGSADPSSSSPRAGWQPGGACCTT